MQDLGNRWQVPKPCGRARLDSASHSLSEDYMSQSTSAFDIQTIGIIGAGTMGSGIAQACASAGFTVVMVDINDAATAKGLATIRSSLERLLKKEKISALELDATLARIQTATDYQTLQAAQLIIESATKTKRSSSRSCNRPMRWQAQRSSWRPTPRQSPSPDWRPRPAAPSALSACTSSTQCP